MLDQALGVLSNDLAIDLGSANTLVFVVGRGVVVDEPSVVAVERERGATRVIAIGTDAKRMVGRTPENIRAISPIKNGIVADFELTESLLRNCIERALGNRPLVKPRMIVCVSQSMDEVARRAVQDSVRAAGARQVHLVSKSVAAALGSDLPISQPRGHMVVDIGGGTTEVGIISLGGVVVNASLPIGGDHFDMAIVDWFRQHAGVLLGHSTAEKLKLDVGCAAVPQQSRVAHATGRDLKTGIPRKVQMTSEDAAAALRAPLEQIVEGLRDTMRKASAELAADLLDGGMVLCGGSALLTGLDQFLRDSTGLPVVMSADPRRCAALGAGQLLQDPETLARVAM